MNFNKFSAGYKAMKSENAWGRIIIAGCIGIIGVLSMATLFQKPVITLVPPALDAQAKLYASKAQAGIHQAWSLYLAQTLGNVTPDTAEFARTTIEPLLGSAIRKDALVILDKQIDRMQRDEVSFSFEPREVQFDEKTNTTYVIGRHYTHSMAGNPERVNRTYEFQWAFDNYMPKLTYIDTYEGAPRLK